MGIVDEEGNFPRSRQAFSADAISTMFGAFFGLSPVTSYIESAAGVEAGSRTGLTAVFCGIFFLLSIFFAPIIASIPPWATGGALIIVGALMCRSLNKIKWYDPSHAISAFLVVMVMPLTYSIAHGLIAGIGSYLIMHGTFFILDKAGIPYPVFEDKEDVNTAEKAVEEEADEEKKAKEESVIDVDE
jgi:AGZA family xanthine/uracil permease-like MFS transporter